MVNSGWTHIVKLYGMLYNPWLVKLVLDCALHCPMGQASEGDSCDEELAQFIDECMVGDDVRKNKQF